MLARYDRTVIGVVLRVQQVDEGDTSTVTIRETDAALSSLIWTLIGLGILTLVATAIFWWLTRPAAVPISNSQPDDPELTQYEKDLM